MLTCFSAAAFETSQLPLSEEVAKTFPEIKSNCYIVVVPEMSIVFAEKNSQRVIESGTFKEIYGGNEQTTLYEMSKRITYFRRYYFTSGMSGTGCAYKYKNVRGVTFTCIIYGEQSKEEASSDTRKITNWLDQFYLYNANIKEPIAIKVPVLYGTTAYANVQLPEKQLIMLSANIPKRVEKVYRYRTIIKAPIIKGAPLGYVLYYTSVFKNPITRVMYAKENIDKRPWHKCICDSIKYLIFGS